MLNLNTIQKLKLDLEVEIPKDSILIKRIELEELKRLSLTGIYWTMKDLENRINKKQEWIKENILYPTEFRKKLDTDLGGFVYYPKSKGQTWSFHALKMADFLDKNFHQIFS